MPCLFGSVEHRQAQNIHLLAVRQALVGMAKIPGEPCVLLGDFNIRPDSSAYKLFSGGCLGSEEAPDTERYRRIYTEAPLCSAYASFHGSEASSYTLDYIWMSDGCLVTECPKLDFDAQRPSASEPSDHLMVEAVVELPFCRG